MLMHYCLQRAIFTDVEIGWKKAKDIQTKTLHQSIESLTVELSHVGRFRVTS